MDKIEERRRKEREYYAKNREAICARKVAQRKTEEGKAYLAEYRKTEKYQTYKEEFAKTEANKKCKRICKWKRSGVQHPDFDELYNIWKSATNCADCDVELVESGINGATRKCLDHDHTTGLFRDIVCHSCNCRRYQSDLKIMR
jgi:hypothetical protein